MQRRGIAALHRELGTEGLMKFFEKSGTARKEKTSARNYTRDRYKLLPKQTLEQLFQKIDAIQTRDKAN